MAIKDEKIIGAIQCTLGGPRLVQANPNSPIVRRGATEILSVKDLQSENGRSHHITASTDEPLAAVHRDLALGLYNGDGSRAGTRRRL